MPVVEAVGGSLFGFGRGRIQSMLVTCANPQSKTA